MSAPGDAPAPDGPHRTAVVARVAELVVLAALCLLGVHAQLRWSRDFREPAAGPVAVRVARATAVGALLDAQGPMGEKAVRLWAWPPPPGGGVDIAAALLRSMTGNTSEGLLNALSLFLCLALAGTWVLGRASGGVATAAAAASLVLADPRFLHAARRYGPEMPFTAMVIATLAALMLTDGFRRPLAAGLAALFLGLTIRIDAVAALMLALPFLWTLVWGVREERSAHRRLRGVVIAASLAAAAALALAAPAVLARGGVPEGVEGALTSPAQTGMAALREVFSALSWGVVAFAPVGLGVAIASPRKRGVLAPIAVALGSGLVLLFTVPSAVPSAKTAIPALMTLLAVGVIPNRPRVAVPIFLATVLLTVPVLFAAPMGAGGAVDPVVARLLSASLAVQRSDAPDREAMADALARAALPARYVALLGTRTSDRAREDFDTLYCLLVAAFNRGGAPPLVTRQEMGDGRLEPCTLLSFEPPLARTLAAWRGETLPAESDPPSVVLFERTVPEPQLIARRLYGREYRSVPTGFSDVVMLRRSDVGASKEAERAVR